MTAFYQHLSSLKEFCDKGYFWEIIFILFFGKCLQIKMWITGLTRSLFSSLLFLECLINETTLNISVHVEITQRGGERCSPGVRS